MPNITRGFSPSSMVLKGGFSPFLKALAGRFSSFSRTLLLALLRPHPDLGCVRRDGHSLGYLVHGPSNPLGKEGAKAKLLMMRPHTPLFHSSRSGSAWNSSFRVQLGTSSK